MSSMRRVPRRSHARLRHVHISPLMQWRICRAFSRPLEKLFRIEPGFARSKVTSSASVYESASA